MKRPIDLMWCLSVKTKSRWSRLHAAVQPAQGLCHHVIGLMYTLAHYQLLGLKSVPPVVSKTSKPQVNFSIKLLKKYKLLVPFWIFYGLTSGLHIVVSNNCKRVYLN